MRDKFFVKGLLFTVFIFIASTAIAVPFKVVISPGTLYQGIANNVAFTITNKQNVPIKINRIDIKGPKGFTFSPDSDLNCRKTLQTNESCTTDANFYEPESTDDKWQVSVQTNYGAVIYNLFKKGTIVNNETTIVINPSPKDKPQDVIIDDSNPTGSFSVKNIGDNPWVNADVVFDAKDSNWLKITSSTCTGTIAPNTTCEVSYTAEKPFGSGTSTVTATGDTINLTTRDVEVKNTNTLSIGLEKDNQFIHLGYRAIKITNLNSKAESITDVKTSISDSLKGKIVFCDGSNNCNANFLSDCLNTTLGSGKMCHLWFKAIDSDVPTDELLGNISIVVQPQGLTPLQRKFQVNYSDLLYTGLKTAKSSTTHFLACNDNNCFPLGGLINKDIKALVRLNGDLYAGGDFTSISGIHAGRMARWNGVGWYPLKDDFTDGSVNALVTLNGNLYAGGDFTKTDGGASVDYIGKFNGTKWSALSSSTPPFTSAIKALATLNGDLYAGGEDEGVAKFINKSQQWSLDTEIKYMYPISSLINFNNRVCAGGEFTAENTKNQDLKFIACWDGVNWQPLGTGMNNLTTSLATSKGKLYAGGYYNEAGSIEANGIASWDGTQWRSLNSSDAFVNTIAVFGNNTYIGTEGGKIKVSSNAKNWSVLYDSNGKGSASTFIHVPSLTIQ